MHPLDVNGENAATEATVKIDLPRGIAAVSESRHTPATFRIEGARRAGAANVDLLHSYLAGERVRVVNGVPVASILLLTIIAIDMTAARGRGPFVRSWPA
jgi:hypothetical protein